MQELLRLYPSGGFTRSCLTDVQISDDLTLPKGTDVLVYPSLIHRNPGNFENAEEFIPERWLNQQDSDKQETGYRYATKMESVARTQCFLCFLRY